MLSFCAAGKSRRVGPLLEAKVEGFGQNYKVLGFYVAHSVAKIVNASCTLDGYSHF